MIIIDISNFWRIGKWEEIKADLVGYIKKCSLIQFAISDQFFISGKAFRKYKALQLIKPVLLKMADTILSMIGSETQKNAEIPQCGFGSYFSYLFISNGLCAFFIVKSSMPDGVGAFFNVGSE